LRGNALVTRLIASEVRVEEGLRDAPEHDRFAELDYRRQFFDAEAEDLRERGRRPYVVLGSSTSLGVMGYVAATGELQRQARQLGISFAKVFVTSLGATHAGLVLGAHLVGAPDEVIGFAYQPVERAASEANVRELVVDGACRLGQDPPTAAVIETDVGDCGSRYGASTPRSRNALRLAAASEALVLDPTYTAKGFAGMLRWISEGRVAEGESVLFIHTGGTPGLFARSWRELARA